MNNKKYLRPSDIDIGNHQFTINKIIQMIKCGDLILDKSFRKTRDEEWNQEKKSYLIESLMIKVPIGDFYFEMTKDMKYIVVDGWQRLNALNKFICIEKDSSERICLSGLKYMENFEECFWEELSVPIRRRISERYVDIYILNAWVPEEIKEDIFIRMG